MKVGRYTTLAAAATLTVALTLQAVPASAYAGRSHGAAGSEPLIIHTRHGLALTPAPPLPKGIPIAGEVTINVGTLRKEYPATPDNTVLGYFFCLYHAYDSCIGENRGEPGEAPAGAPMELPSTHQVLAWIVNAVGAGAVWTSLVAIVKAYKSDKFQIRGLFKKNPNQVATDPQDEWCEGGFGPDRVDILASCGENHGVFWQLDHHGTAIVLHNTESDDAIVYCNCKGTSVFDWWPQDWDNWGMWVLTSGSQDSMRALSLAGSATVTRAAEQGTALPHLTRADYAPAA